VAGRVAAASSEGRRRDRTAVLSRTADRADHVALTEPDGARVRPAARRLAGLLRWPGRVRRGSTVAAVGSASVLFVVPADGGATGAGVVVGVPGRGAAAAGYGIDLTRLALVPGPGGQRPLMAGALLGGLRVVVVATPDDIPVTTVRSRGCLLVPTRAWAGCDLTRRLVGRRGRGLPQGRGRLRLQQDAVSGTGRGRADAPRHTSATVPPPLVTVRVGALSGRVSGHAGLSAARRSPGRRPTWPWRAGRVTGRPAGRDPGCEMVRQGGRPRRWPPATDGAAGGVSDTARDGAAAR
jgi:hypothetical protein